MDPTLDIVGHALIELADIAESSKGEMLPPTLVISSRAHQEYKLDASWGDPNTIAAPLYDTFAHLELLFHASCDHLRSLGKLLVGDPVSWFGHIAVARSVAETGSRLWYLADDNIDALARVGRHLAERQEELKLQHRHLTGAWSTWPPPILASAQDHVAATQLQITNWAKAHGLNTRQQEGVEIADVWRPGSTRLLALLYEADPSAVATQGQAGALATYHYFEQSAVAHGGPSGVALYHQPAGPGGHAHNVLSHEQVGHSVLPALTAFHAGFDRVSRYFWWPHPDYNAIVWNTIHQVNGAIGVAAA